MITGTSGLGHAPPAGPPQEAPPAPACIVAVHAADRVTADGASAWLQASPGITPTDASQWRDADVSLFIASEVTDVLLHAMRGRIGCGEDVAQPIVLVAHSITDRQLLTAVDYGLVSFLIRDTVGLREIADALIEAKSGKSQLPGPMIRHLISEMRARRQSMDDISGRTGLQAREIQVLRMLAEGLDTNEIASRLNYSDRTIKGIIHDVVKRLGLRNRIQAVAYGLRTGAL
ncbi:LuxR C-terminal-related transcriptional regulator [Streptomyces sp. WAC 01325]|uniref:helix-turn-helix transcriptional regulator n=1 Tax=Streptomyces sp. WAC 01325 TaxID=2203202 RepID=UPI00163BA829|nr:LuxR C-terminal-related transcriptional regulator [Streptomyces sp. WAC 01325]